MICAECRPTKIQLLLILKAKDALKSNQIGLVYARERKITIESTYTTLY